VGQWRRATRGEPAGLPDAGRRHRRRHRPVIAEHGDTRRAEHTGHGTEQHAGTDRSVDTMRTPMRRRLALLAAAALTAATTTWTVHAQTTDPGDGGGGGGNNNAVAINTRNGSSVFDIAFSVVRATGDTVANQNIALAYASCTSCKTVAIAFQVVLITGDPSTVTPVNEAVAVNYQCTLCSTMAEAVQFVVSTPGPVTFTAEGRK